MRQHIRRRVPVILLLLAGALVQDALVVLLYYFRDVEWAKHLMWGLQWPLYPLAYALNVRWYLWVVLSMGPLNGLCWSLLGFGIIWFVRRTHNPPL